MRKKFSSKEPENEIDLEEDLVDLEVLSPVSHMTLLFGGIADKQAAEIVSWILMNNMLDEKPDELIILINSPGGEIQSAFAIIEAIRGSLIPVRTIGIGQIMSAGLMIFMSGTKGRRVITPTCAIMSHSLSTGLGGTYHEISNTKTEIDRVHKRMIDLYTASTGKSEAYVKKHLLAHNDAWMLPEDAVKFRLADGVSGIEQYLR